MQDMARFYIAQCLVAIETVHALGFAHRDITAENVLLSARGHVLLADFGSCIRCVSLLLVHPIVVLSSPNCPCLCRNFAHWYLVAVCLLAIRLVFFFLPESYVRIAYFFVDICIPKAITYI
jgi:serine/threonine protein kinase